MGQINNIYKYQITPSCNKKAVVKGDKYRFTVLTPSLIRMEYSENGVFEDRATKVVINRDFPVPSFTVKEDDEKLMIYTDHIELTYQKGFPFCSSSLTARFYGDWGDNTNWWRFENDTVPYGGVVQNYWGTLDSLDLFNGPVPLNKGLASPHFTEWDDSKSMILDEDGWVEERPDDTVDTYLFAYRTHHVECLNDFLTLSGKIPMLPRYALGNWWCRYYAYSDKEYLELMDKFEQKSVPLSVAMLDMDWHITEVEKKYGTGWTGYSWNKKLFPNPKAFTSELNRRGLRVGVNLHDREGIAPHEDNYLPMAKELGVDWENGQKIAFDFCNPKYIEAYFRYTHHNNEEDGISFWWVDGYPENSGRIKKADIPWMLNHYHYLDSKKNGKRGMLLSRNCGMGGHRYGVGFSGDTEATWEMLDFLPYFTATAANVGFGWWSHDVGGFMNGIRSDEMMVRWVQFSVFSPIFRLHSTNNRFMSKEPWNYNELAEKIIINFMRLRHELLPYIYTMNHKCYADNITLVRPLYYHCGNHSRCNKNVYYFGDNMLVAPITTPMDNVTAMGSAQIYLPEGEWFDYFNSRRYRGERNYRMYRGIDEIPVLVKSGSIIPCTVLSHKENGIENPVNLKLNIFPGNSNTFKMYEDDNETLAYENGDCVVTEMNLEWGSNPVFTIKKPMGNVTLIPSKRNYTLCFRKINDSDNIVVKLDGKEIVFKKDYSDDMLIINVQGVSGELTVEFKDEMHVLANDYTHEFDSVLMKMQMSNTDKLTLSNLLRKTGSRSAVVSELSSERFDENFKNVVDEIFFADAN